MFWESVSYTHLNTNGIQDPDSSRNPDGTRNPGGEESPAAAGGAGTPGNGEDAAENRMGDTGGNRNPSVSETSGADSVYQWNRRDMANVKLPSAYDYRKTGRAPQIGNQGSLGTCWAFASLTALESSLLPGKPMTFAVDHMSMHNSFLLGQDEGGEYTLSLIHI